MLKNIQILFLKLFSTLILCLAFIFLYIINRMVAIGEFSSYTAIFAPIVMFSQFRYVEYLNLDNEIEKKKRFLISLNSSVLLFLSLSLIVLFFIDKIDIYLILVIILYKTFEMVTDFIISYLVSNNEIKQAFSSILLRLLIFIILLSYYFIGNIDMEYILYIYLSLMISYFFGVVFDLYLKRYIFQSGYIKLNYIFNYIKGNAIYGLSSLIISLNSIMPRYFFLFYKNMEGLGIFTILYLMASSSTTIFQFVISSRVKELKRIVLYKSGKFFKFSAFILSISFSIYFIGYLIDEMGYLYFIIMIPSLFLSLMIRGINLTALISIDKKYGVSFSLMLSMLLSFVFILIATKINNDFNIGLANFYVLLSCLLTCVITYIIIKRTEKNARA